MVSSQTLWRPGPGRRAASSALIRRSAPRRLGPCQAFLSNASSSRPSNSWISGFMGPPLAYHPRTLTKRFCFYWKTPEEESDAVPVPEVRARGGAHAGRRGPRTAGLAREVLRLPDGRRPQDGALGQDDRVLPGARESQPARRGRRDGQDDHGQPVPARDDLVACESRQARAAAADERAAL